MAYLSSLPLLSPSQLGEELFLYLAVSLAAVNAALVREEDRVQRPMYYTSRALKGAKERYPPIEKLTFDLVTAAHKLNSYFQAHSMIVLTEKPLRRAISNPNAAGQMTLWAVELSEFDIQYRPCTAIKGQVVADFIAEFTNVESQGAREYPQWNIHTDGSSNKQAGEAGIVLRSLEGDKIECMVRLDFPMTNNEAEYEALVMGLDLAKAARATSVIIHCDSQVITNQINGDYECKGERMKKYLEQENRRVDDLQAKIVQIPRGKNDKPTVLPRPHQQNTWSSSIRYSPFIHLSPLIDVVNVKEMSFESNWTTP
ncbi:uncharacterized protein LOC142628925 [Castanea sativa]|uniref:uncharacterized protein LOC142628925 n=1 Tax=Castanea sativa TaxID=21020 RepID=UPI003F64D661